MFLSNILHQKLPYLVTALQEDDHATIKRIIEEAPKFFRPLLVNHPYKNTIPIFHAQSFEALALLHDAGARLSKRQNGKSLFHVCNSEVAEAALKLSSGLATSFLGCETDTNISDSIRGYLLRAQCQPKHANGPGVLPEIA